MKKFPTPASYGAVAPPGDPAKTWPLNRQDMTRYWINTIYPTIQGEGAKTGTPMTIVRLQGCPVGCAFCDTPETWALPTEDWLTASEVASSVDERSLDWALVTGGEPTWHELGALTAELRMRGIKCALETAAPYPITGIWDWVCFPKGTLIETSDGAKTIETVFPGERVLDAQGAWSTVARIGARQHIGKIITLRISGLPDLELTEEHPLYVAAPRRVRSGTDDWDYRWIPADHVRPGMFLAATCAQEDKHEESIVVNVRNPELPMNDSRREYSLAVKLEPDLFRLAGYFLAEGYVGWTTKATTYPWNVSFAWHEKERSYRTFVASAMAKYFGARHPHVRQRGASKGVEQSFGSRVAAEFFATFGRGAKNKCIPAWLALAPRKLQLRTLRAYLQGDGTKIGRGRWIATTASRSLAYSIRQIALRCGGAVGLKTYLPGAPGTFPSQNTFYKLDIVMRPRRMLKGRHKISRAGAYQHHRVRAISSRVANEPVFNLETLPSHTYSAGGIIAHNCISPKPYGLIPILDDVENLRQADEIKWIVGSETNVEALKIFLDAHGAKLKASCVIALQPMSCSERATTACVEAVMREPRWRLSIQTHKLIDRP